MNPSAFRQRLAGNRLYQRLSEEKYCMMTRVSPTWNTRVRWKQAFSRTLDLENPEWFGEKLSAIKLKYYNDSTLIQKLASKDAVADYVRYCGCGDTLKTCYGVWDSFDEIPFDQLPDRFVLKSTTGCGSHVFCTDKRMLDMDEARRTMAHALKNHDHLLYAELQYRGKRRIMAEEFLDAPNGQLPDDIKIYCFHGEPTFPFFCYDRDTHGKARIAMTDRNWKPLPDHMVARVDVPEEKPARFDEMMALAKKLCGPFPFVRVDFYQVGGRVVFGELTFTPAGGILTLHTPKGHREVGKHLDMARAAAEVRAFPALEKAIYGG